MKRRRPGTFINEFEGASEAEIRDARPTASELGSRRSTLYIFLFLFAAAIGLLVAAGFIYEERSLALLESVSELFASDDDDDDEEAGGTTGGGETTEATPPDLPPPTPDLPPPVKELELGALEVSGKLAESSVKRSLDKIKPKLETCLEEARGRAEGFAGSLEVSFTIKWSGKTSGYKAEASGGEDEKFEACVKKQVTRTRFGKPRGGGSAKVKQRIEY